MRYYLLTLLLLSACAAPAVQAPPPAPVKVAPPTPTVRRVIQREPQPLPEQCETRKAEFDALDPEDHSQHQVFLGHYLGRCCNPQLFRESKCYQ